MRSHSRLDTFASRKGAGLLLSIALLACVCSRMDFHATWRGILRTDMGWLLEAVGPGLVMVSPGVDPPVMLLDRDINYGFILAAGGVLFLVERRRSPHASEASR